MDSAASLPASTRAFDILELLELILLQVDQRTLLTSCLRINKTFNIFITSSARLQRRLYFRADTPNAARSPEGIPKGIEYRTNPLLDDAFPNWFRNGRWPKRVTSNSTHSGAEYSVFHALPWNKHPKAWRYEKASWRKMFISQPPSYQLRIVNGLSPAAVITWKVNIPYRLGLTMGQLYDWVDWRMFRFKRHVPGSDFNFAHDGRTMRMVVWEDARTCVVEGLVPKFQSSGYVEPRAVKRLERVD